MADIIKYCSDSFYAGCDQFAILFREAFGFACFVGFSIAGLFLFVGLIVYIYETVKEKLLSIKQRKVDKDA